MRQITLDGREMQTKEEAHLHLKSKLNIRGYYGNNLDALWDVLSTYDQPIGINLIHHEQLDSYGEAIIALFKDVSEENSSIIFKVRGD